MATKFTARHRVKARRALRRVCLRLLLLSLRSQSGLTRNGRPIKRKMLISLWAEIFDISTSHKRNPTQFDLKCSFPVSGFQFLRSLKLCLSATHCHVVCFTFWSEIALEFSYVHDISLSNLRRLDSNGK